MNQWQKGKFLYSFIYFIFSKNSAPIGGGGKQCECIRIYVYTFVCRCVCVWNVFYRCKEPQQTWNVSPCAGELKKKGGMEDFLKERENSSVMNSRRDCLFHLPPFFFFLLCIFLFFFLIVYGVLLLLLSGDSLWCYSNL